MIAVRHAHPMPLSGGASSRKRWLTGNSREKLFVSREVRAKGPSTFQRKVTERPAPDTKPFLSATCLRRRPSKTNAKSYSTVSLSFLLNHRCGRYGASAVSEDVQRYCGSIYWSRSRGFCSSPASRVVPFVVVAVWKLLLLLLLPPSLLFRVVRCLLLWRSLFVY